MVVALLTLASAGIFAAHIFDALRTLVDSILRGPSGKPLGNHGMAMSDRSPTPPLESQISTVDRRSLVRGNYQAKRSAPRLKNTDRRNQYPI